MGVAPTRFQPLQARRGGGAPWGQMVPSAVLQEAKNTHWQGWVILQSLNVGDLCRLWQSAGQSRSASGDQTLLQPPCRLCSERHQEGWTHLWSQGHAPDHPPTPPPPRAGHSHALPGPALSPAPGPAPPPHSITPHAHAADSSGLLSLAQNSRSTGECDGGVIPADSQRAGAEVQAGAVLALHTRAARAPLRGLQALREWPCGPPSPEASSVVGQSIGHGPSAKDRAASRPCVDTHARPPHSGESSWGWLPLGGRGHGQSDGAQPHLDLVSTDFPTLGELGRLCRQSLPPFSPSSPQGPWGPGDREVGCPGGGKVGTPQGPPSHNSSVPPVRSP